MTSRFNQLLETYTEECGAVVEETRTTNCHCIEFHKKGFPSHHTLGSKALDHGFIVSAVDPTNELSENGVIPVFFKKFTMRREERTVEVEKEVTVVRANGEDHVIEDI